MTPPPNLPAGTEFLPPEVAQRVVDWVWNHNKGEGLMCREKPNGEWSPCQIAICFDKYEHVAPAGTIAAATTPLPEPRCDCMEAHAEKPAVHSPTCSIHLRYRHILPGELAKMPTKPEGLLKASRGKNDWHEVATWPLIQRFVDGVYDFAYALPLPPQPEKGKGGVVVCKTLMKTIEERIVEIAKLWKGHEGVNYQTTTIADILTLIEDAVKYDQRMLLERMQKHGRLRLAICETLGQEYVTDESAIAGLKSVTKV